MRSWPSAVLVLVVAASCGNDTRVECTDSPLTYQTFGDPFIASWCRGCHSAELVPTMRQAAPLDVNFDTPGEVRAHRMKILELAGTSAQMPPSGGPSDEERALLREWLACGAK